MTMSSTWASTTCGAPGVWGLTPGFPWHAERTRAAVRMYGTCDRCMRFASHTPGRPATGDRDEARGNPVWYPRLLFRETISNHGDDGQQRTRQPPPMESSMDLHASAARSEA